MADISIFHMQLGKNRWLRNGWTKVNTVQEPFLFPHKISKSVFPILSGCTTSSTFFLVYSLKKLHCGHFPWTYFSINRRTDSQNFLFTSDSHSYRRIIKSQKNSLTTELYITESFKTNCYIFISTLSSAS